jgi:hypothetical protein
MLHFQQFNANIRIFFGELIFFAYFFYEGVKKPWLEKGNMPFLTTQNLQGVS